MFWKYLLFTAVIRRCLSAPAQAFENGPIQQPSGRYEGLNDGNTTVYYGIPYAYAERFQAPQQIESKPGIDSSKAVNASQYGPACFQFSIPTSVGSGLETFAPGIPLGKEDEECSSMDIHVPNGKQSVPLPVLFWTPGGGYLTGASHQHDFRPLINHALEMNKPFIGVSINYRLGPLGFLGTSNVPTNAGVSDQLEALRYVRKHIGAFGGDPEKLIIMGESAGAGSTFAQFLNADTPFRGAWFASIPIGPQMGDTEFKPRDPIVQSYAQACGCPSNQSIDSTVDCLKTIDPRSLANNSDAWLGLGIQFGGPIKQNVFKQIRAQDYKKVPTVFSTCRDEATNHVIGYNATNETVVETTIQGFVESANLTQEQTDAFTKEMLEAYPNDDSKGCPFDGLNTSYGQPAQFKRIAAIVTDEVYAQPWTEYLEAFRETGTWGLLFNETIPKVDDFYGVQHGSDSFYIFPTFGGPDKDPRNSEHAGAVETMQTAVVNFVNDLDPNGAECNKETRWTKSDGKKVAQITRDGLAMIDQPKRPGFDVLKKYLVQNGKV